MGILHVNIPGMENAFYEATTAVGVALSKGEEIQMTFKKPVACNMSIGVKEKPMDPDEVMDLVDNYAREAWGFQVTDPGNNKEWAEVREYCEDQRNEIIKLIKEN